MKKIARAVWRYATNANIKRFFIRRFDDVRLEVLTALFTRADVNIFNQ
ncbi:hypothetical protein MZI83_21090 [Escherichia coli]|nr:hypothetical protein [Escherichia coli]